jgi:hypothetical protein
VDGGGLGDLARNAGADQSNGTWELWRACNGGSAAACGQMEAINQADLAAGLEHIRTNHRDVLNRINGDPTIIWENSPDFVDIRSGTTDFFSGNVHLSRAYATRQDFVNTLGHELLHSGDGIAGRAITNFQDAVARFRGAPLGLGPRHTAIYRRADEIGATFGR